MASVQLHPLIHKKLIATASEDHYITIWSTHILQQIIEDHHHLNTVKPIEIKLRLRSSSVFHTMCFSLNNRYLATGSDDGSIKVWDIDARKAIYNNRRAYHWSAGRISRGMVSLCFYNQTSLISCCGEGMIKFWDCEEEMRGYSMRPSEIEGVKKAAPFLHENTLVNPHPYEVWSEHQSSVGCQLSPCERQLIYLSSKSLLKIYELEMEEEGRENNSSALVSGAQRIGEKKRLKRKVLLSVHTGAEINLGVFLSSEEFLICGKDDKLRLLPWPLQVNSEGSISEAFDGPYVNAFHVTEGMLVFGKGSISLFNESSYHLQEKFDYPSGCIPLAVWQRNNATLHEEKVKIAKNNENDLRGEWTGFLLFTYQHDRQKMFVMEIRFTWPIKHDLSDESLESAVVKPMYLHSSDIEWGEDDSPPKRNALCEESERAGSSKKDAHELAKPIIKESISSIEQVDSWLGKHINDVVRDLRGTTTERPAGGIIASDTLMGQTDKKGVIKENSKLYESVGTRLVEKNQIPESYIDRIMEIESLMTKKEKYRQTIEKGEDEQRREEKRETGKDKDDMVMSRDCASVFERSRNRWKSAKNNQQNNFKLENAIKDIQISLVDASTGNERNNGDAREGRAKERRESRERSWSKKRIDASHSLNVNKKEQTTYGDIVEKIRVAHLQFVQNWNRQCNQNQS